MGRALSLMIYKSLVQDVFLFEDEVSLNRKKELSTALIAISLDPASVQALILKLETDTQVSSKRVDFDSLISWARNGLGSNGVMTVLIEDLRSLRTAFSVSYPYLSRLSNLVFMMLYQIAR